MDCLAVRLNVGMDIADIWTAHIKRIVEDEAAKVGGNKRSGYRAVAEKTHFGQEYVYQICTDRKKPGKDFAAAVGRAYANGREPGWINVEAGQDEAPAPAPLDTRSHPELSRIATYFLELPPDEQSAVMRDLHARAARVMGERALQQATGYAPPSRHETRDYSPEARRLAAYFDDLNPEVRARAFATAQAALVKATQPPIEEPADAPAPHAASGERRAWT